MRGDLILYKSSGRWYERAIVLATHGIFVHVAIQLSNVQVIAAGSKGIALFPYSVQDNRCVTVPIGPHATPQGIEQGLTWAMEQEGRRYSWWDIFYQAVKFMNPNNPFRFYREGEYDCSDYASRYLIKAGVQLPEAFQDPYSNSPCDLARWAGLIPPRKG